MEIQTLRRARNGDIPPIEARYGVPPNADYWAAIIFSPDDPTTVIAATHESTREAIHNWCMRALLHWPNIIWEFDH